MGSPQNPHPPKNVQIPTETFTAIGSLWQKFDISGLSEVDQLRYALVWDVLNQKLQRTNARIAYTNARLAPTAAEKDAALQDYLAIRHGERLWD